MKQSLLYEAFGKETLNVGPINQLAREGRNIQSTKSKFLKFESRICEPCNSDRTQPADRQFDRFIRKILAGCSLDATTGFPLKLGQVSLDREERLGICRYLAKLMCCFLTEEGFPVPRRLSQLAINRTDENGIQFDVTDDENYAKMVDLIGAGPYAAHEGVSAQISKDDLRVGGFESATSFGPARIIFDFRLTSDEQDELEQDYPEVVIRSLRIVREKLLENCE